MVGRERSTRALCAWDKWSRNAVKRRHSKILGRVETRSRAKRNGRIDEWKKDRGARGDR
jgi:hypothetical protein